MYEQNEEKNVNKSDEVIINENMNVINKKIKSDLKKAISLSFNWLIINFFIYIFLTFTDSNDIFFVSRVIEGSGVDGLAVIMLCFCAIVIFINIIIYLIPACIAWRTAWTGTKAATISSIFCIVIYWIVMGMVLTISSSNFLPGMTFILSLITIVIGLRHIVATVKYDKGKNK